MRSLQSRLGSGLLLSLVITFSALWLLVSINIQYLAEEYISSRLEHDAESLLNTISFDSNNNLTIDNNRIGAVYNQPFSGHYYVVSTGSVRLNSRSLWDQSLDDKTVSTGSLQRSLQRGPENQSLLIISAGYSKQGHEFTISVAENLDPVKENITQFRYWFAGMALGLLSLLMIVQSIILHISLKPLGRIRDELKSLEQGQLDKLSTDTPDELRPLINEVNHLLSMVAQRLQRSRDSLGDLAHSIKKPLTVIRQLTDTDDMPGTTRDILKKQTDDIHQLTDRILKRARLAGHGRSGALFSFTADLPDLVKTLNMIYAGKSLRIRTNTPDNITCSIDREDMMELLGNLLDNACKWARHDLTISVNIDSAVHIRIEDDGPGVDPEKINALSSRGFRLDETVQGHGFGLAIAADIVKDYQGNISYGPSASLGGLSVEVILPLNQPPPNAL